MEDMNYSQMNSDSAVLVKMDEKGQKNHQNGLCPWLDTYLK